MYKKIILDHYANHRSVEGFVTNPTSNEEVANAIEWAVSRGLKVVPIGAQNSFSDIFLSAGQLHLSLLSMNQLMAFDPIKEEISVQSGMRIWDLLSFILPKGLYLTGLSGSHTDTIGGMLSSNCHGKDSWRWGNFGENIISLKMIDQYGLPKTLYPSDPMFKAIISGLGGLGVVVEVTLKLKKLPSPILSTSSKAISIEEAVELRLTDVDYCYGWLDILTNRKSNCILRTATFNPNAQHSLKETNNEDKLWNKHPRIFWKGIRAFWNPVTYKVVNKIIYIAEKNKSTPSDLLITHFLYPWKQKPGVRYVFKSNSFYELQTIFPFNTFNNALLAIKGLMKEYNILPMMSALKWHRPDDFLLSFSGSGLSLSNTFDLAYLNTPKGDRFIKAYTELVLNFEGRFYLSKFPYIDKCQLLESHPNAQKWLAIKHEVDPQNIFCSDRMSLFL